MGPNYPDKPTSEWEELYTSSDSDVGDISDKEIEDDSSHRLGSSEDDNNIKPRWKLNHMNPKYLKTNKHVLSNF